MANSGAPSCINCTEACIKPLKCSVCKAATYCSAACQKEDWRFHKRICKKAEAPAAPAEQEKPSPQKDAEMQKQLDDLTKDNPALKSTVEQMMQGMMGGGDDKAGEAKQPEKVEVRCRNCDAACAKPLRCGVCKEATYCSGKCQKEDWQYHKRTCKKPEAKATAPYPLAGMAPPGGPGADAAAAASAAPTPSAASTSAPKPEPLRPKGEDKTVVNEDVGTWYKHREWKPEEPKKDFAPARVDAPEAIAGTGKSSGSSSTWNKAGTWEEKNMLDWWRSMLPSLTRISLEKFGGTTKVLTVDEVTEATGEATITFIRGTPRFFFDLRFEVNFSYKYPTSSRSAYGHVKYTDFTHEAAAEGKPFCVEIVCASGSDADKKAADTDLRPRLEDRLRQIIAEYEDQVDKKNGKAFPGQLPPSSAAAT
eukprot:TRINITY_DN8704_c0_g1_i5.p1 TRINITY_DN8704_c0_g1~~TRINITY_DN8704_c0_g1_i5.p1  ORF type:complete len:421 (-),score=134.50 TRINITY_DN8704_c0_g1_i5:42-1304(-)